VPAIKPNPGKGRSPDLQIRLAKIGSGLADSKIIQ
jgi:hypothetical protein